MLFKLSTSRTDAMRSVQVLVGAMLLTTGEMLTPGQAHVTVVGDKVNINSVVRA